MNCCSANEASRKNEEINKSLKKDQVLISKEVKLLLLGAGSCGKSTIVKQMRIIHGGGFSENERRDFRIIVLKNMIQTIQTLIAGIEVLSIPCEVSSLTKLKEIEHFFKTTAPEDIDMKLFHEYTNIIWNDAAIQQCLSKRNVLLVEDSAQYFYDHLERICSLDYIPTEQDILRSRIATSGIIEYRFNFGETVYRMIDVGGQRSERRKWIHCFENVTAIIFVVALSEYDMVLAEDRNHNRMRESLALFDKIINYEWFRSASIILFLNKKDVLAEKVKTSPISAYFPEYYGDTQDVNSVQEFILDMYVDLNRSETKPIYPHFTCAPDTTNIKFVFEAVADTILTNNLRGYGLI
eukprot:Sdes_comp15344_c0_seq1m4210